MERKSLLWRKEKWRSGIIIRSKKAMIKLSKCIFFSTKNKKATTTCVICSRAKLFRKEETFEGRSNATKVKKLNNWIKKKKKKSDANVWSTTRIEEDKFSSESPITITFQRNAALISSRQLLRNCSSRDYPDAIACVASRCIMQRKRRFNRPETSLRWIARRLPEGIELDGE